MKYFLNYEASVSEFLENIDVLHAWWCMHGGACMVVQVESDLAFLYSFLAIKTVNWEFLRIWRESLQIQNDMFLVTNSNCAHKKQTYKWNVCSDVCNTFVIDIEIVICVLFVVLNITYFIILVHLNLDCSLDYYQIDKIKNELPH